MPRVRRSEDDDDDDYGDAHLAEAKCRACCATCCECACILFVIGAAYLRLVIARWYGDG